MQRLIDKYKEAEARAVAEGSVTLPEYQITQLVGRVVRHMLFKNFEKPGAQLEASTCGPCRGAARLWGAARKQLRTLTRAGNVAVLCAVGET